MQDLITLHDVAKVFKTRSKTFEIIYLLYGTKEVTRQIFSNEEMENVAKFCRENSLFFETNPKKISFIDSEESDGYSELGKFVEPDNADYTSANNIIYISKSKVKIVEACLADLTNNHRKLGLLLSYPSCCVRAFSENIEKGKIIEYNVHGFADISKRQQDCSFISHFPCSSNCKASEMLALVNYKIISLIDKELADEVKIKLDSN